MKSLLAKVLALTATLGLAFLLVGPLDPGSAAGKRELNVAYMNYPVHAQQVKWFKKWGEMNGVTVKGTPIPYTVYLEKITASLISGPQEFDIIFHNDDWGQLLGGLSGASGRRKAHLCNGQESAHRSGHALARAGRKDARNGIPPDGNPRHLLLP